MCWKGTEEIVVSLQNFKGSSTENVSYKLDLESKKQKTYEKNSNKCGKLNACIYLFNSTKILVKIKRKK